MFKTMGVIVVAVVLAIGLTAELTRDAAATAAAAAGVTAIIIGWQSSETRRAANAANDGLNKAQDTLDKAGESLEVARKSLREAQVMAVESQRARLDATSPSVRITIEKPQLASGHSSSFRLPKDSDLTVSLETRGSLFNDGARSVRIRFKGDVTGVTRVLGIWQEVGGGYWSLSSAGNVAFVVNFKGTVREWAENYQAETQGKALTHSSSATIDVSDDFDQGIVDQWTICLTGCPLWSSLDGSSSQAYRDYDLSDHVNVTLEPRVRHYWISKRSAVELHQPPADPER